MRAKVTSSLAISFDASLWDEPTTGIGLYARELVQALEAEGVRVRKLGARTSGDDPRGGRGKSEYVLGRLPAVLQGLDEPLYHAVGNFNLPLQRCVGKRFVLTVHDLIPDLLPSTVSMGFRWQFRTWLARSLRVADRIICVSDRTRADLLRRFPVQPERTVVIHHGADHVDRVAHVDATGRAFLEALSLPEEFVLFAGALDVRKNVELILRALKLLRRRDRRPTLVLVGQSWFGSGRAEAEIGRMRAEGFDIRPLGHQSAPIFYELMRSAAVLVFPSRYEGFGLPPLEAMRLGTPTIVSDAGSLPEVCGPGALQVPVDDPAPLAEAIARLLGSPDERRAWSERGKVQAARYSWKACARKTLETYREALEG